MAKPVKFAHVVYQTRRFDEMIAWYETVFEARVVHRNPALAFMTYDDEHHRFAFANLGLVEACLGDGGGVGDLLETYARLKSAGIAPYWPIHHGTTLSMYYKDPDGNRMELQVDCGTLEDATAYMESEGFAANPVGVVIDPEDLLTRYRNGASAEELIAMPDNPPSPIPEEHGFG